MADFTAKSAILSNTARGGWQHRSGGLATPLGGGGAARRPEGAARSGKFWEVLGSRRSPGNTANSASFCQRPAPQPRRDHRPVRADPPRQHLRVQRRRVVPQGAQGPGRGIAGGGLGDREALYIVKSLSPLSLVPPPIHPVRHPQRRVDRVQRLGVVPAEPPQGLDRGSQSFERRRELGHLPRRRPPEVDRPARCGTMPPRGPETALGSADLPDVGGGPCGGGGRRRHAPLAPCAGAGGGRDRSRRLPMLA